MSKFPSLVNLSFVTAHIVTAHMYYAVHFVGDSPSLGLLVDGQFFTAYRACCRAVSSSHNTSHFVFRFIMAERDAFAYRSVSPPMSPSTSTVSSPFLSHKPPDDTHRPEQKPSAHAKRQKYLRRLLKFKQMDFEYAFWQMIYLFVAPQKV